MAHPGHKIMFRCDPHLHHQLLATIPQWCSKLMVEVEFVSVKRIKHEVEIVYETRWDATSESLEAVKQRLTAAKTTRNVRIVAPTVTPK